MSEKPTPKSIMKQTRMPEAVLRKFKAQAATEGRPVKDLYEEAIYDFFSDRREHLKKSTPLNLYNSAPTSGKVVNVELKTTTAKEVDVVAGKDDATGSRVIYTSLIKYADKKKML
jgi:dihydrodipicolinate synthase/N-acetylneuraminate lyase